MSSIDTSSAANGANAVGPAKKRITSNVPSKPLVESRRLPKSHSTQTTVIDEAKVPKNGNPTTSSAPQSATSLAIEEDEEILSTSENILAEMGLRLRTLKVARALWIKNMPTAAIEQIAKTKNAGIIIDFARIIGLTDRPNEPGENAGTVQFVSRTLSLDTCIQFLPSLRLASSDPHDEIACAGLQSINLLIRAFGPVVSLALKKRNAEPLPSMRNAQLEFANIKKFVIGDSSFQKRTTKVQSSRRSLISSLKLCPSSK